MTPMPPRILRLRAPAAAALLLALVLLPGSAAAAILEICRSFDMASPATHDLVVPAGTLFRDNGRADDPLKAFTGDRWQLRLETIADAVIPGLRQCTRAFVRITSDSSVKSVSVADNREFIYAGSSNLLEPPVATEELFTLTGRVLDQVP
jgi:hypothetical protein